MTERSVRLSMPPYVVAKPRKDGTHYVVFAVPTRLRPKGWPPTIRLPLEGSRVGDMRDVKELARIFADATALNLELAAARTPGPRPPGRRTLAALIEQWLLSFGEPGDNSLISARTRRQYTQLANILVAWSRLPPVNDALVSTVTPAQISQLFRVYDDRPTTKRHLRATLSNIMNFGVENAWLDSNPVPKVQRKRRRGGKRKVAVTVWTLADVELHVELALRLGWPQGAVMILGLWESMGRVSDAPLWRRDEHWDPKERTLIYRTSKSDGESVAVAQMSIRFAELVAMTTDDFLVVSPAGKPYRATLDDTRIGEHFRALNAAAIKEGTGRKLILRHLRHSSQTHAAECGVPLDLMRVSTTHTDGEMARRKYLQEHVRTPRSAALSRSSSRS